MTAATSVEAFFLKDCAVPKLKGKGLRAAKRALKAHDCSVGKIGRAFSKHVKKGHVISQKPKPHKAAQARGQGSAHRQQREEALGHARAQTRHFGSRQLRSRARI
jgi:hypothetical protein